MKDNKEKEIIHVERYCLKMWTYKIDAEEYLDWLKKSKEQFKDAETSLREYIDNEGIEYSYVEVHDEDTSQTYVDVENEDTWSEMKLIFTCDKYNL